MAEIQITNATTGGGGGTVNTGVLQIAGGVPVSSTLRDVTDQLGTATALQLSSTGSRIGSGASAGLRLSIYGSSDTAGSTLVEGSSLTGVNSFKFDDSGSLSINASDNNSNLRNIIGKNYNSTSAFEPFKFIGGRARGTSSAPTAVLSNDALTSFDSLGYTGTGWSTTRGGLAIYASENWTPTANGTYISFRGTTMGSTTVSEVARLSETGLSIATIPNATTDTDKFLVSDSGMVKYRTGTELLSDLGISGSVVTGSGAANRVAYWSASGSITGTGSFYWDATNSRLGIGSSAPTDPLTVIGTTKTTNLLISTATAQATAATQFLALDASDSTVKYRTPAQVLSDIGAQAAITNPVTGTGAATRLAFWSSTSAISSSTALNWDNANGRLGIGVASPSARLQVTGDGTANTVRFESSTSTNLFTLSDQGVITAFAPATIALTGTTEINKFTSSFIAPSSGSGSFRPLSIAYTINNAVGQTGTATGIYLDSTETALGGMTHNLMNLLVGAVSKFRVSSIGGVTITGAVSMTSGMFLNGSNPSIYRDSAANSNFCVGTGGFCITSAGFSSPLATAIFQLDSTARGFLLPRMTTTQRTAIASPADGLMVYDTTLSHVCVYQSTLWVKLSHSPA